MSTNNKQRDVYAAVPEPEEPATEAMPEQEPEVTEGSQESQGDSGSDAGRGFRKRRKRIVAASVAAVLTILAAAYFIRSALLYEDTDDAQVNGHVMPLSARVNGHISNVRVVEGQLVHEGDVLVTIDQEDYDIAARQAQANLADALATSASSHWNVPIASATAWSGLDSARAAVRNAEAGVSAAEQNLEASKAALVQAQANAEKSDADLRRYEQLVAKEDVSRQQYDQASAAAKANRAACCFRDCRSASRRAHPPSGRGQAPASQGRPAHCRYRAPAGFADSCQGGGNGRPGVAKKSSICASRAEPQLHGDSLTRHGNRRQEKCRGGAKREYWTGSGGRCASG